MLLILRGAAAGGLMTTARTTHNEPLYSASSPTSKKSPTNLSRHHRFVFHIFRTFVPYMSYPWSHQPSFERVKIKGARRGRHEAVVSTMRPTSAVKVGSRSCPRPPAPPIPQDSSDLSPPHPAKHWNNNTPVPVINSPHQYGVRGGTWGGGFRA